MDDLFSLYGTRATAPMDYIYASGWLSGAIEADISTGTPSTRLRKDQEIQSMQIAFESAFGANRGCQWNYINGALRNMKMAALTGADDEE